MPQTPTKRQDDQLDDDCAASDTDRVEALKKGLGGLGKRCVRMSLHRGPIE